MSVGGGIAIWLGIVVASMAVVAYLAKRWGHDPFGWSLLAAAMGPIAIVAMVGTRQSATQRATATTRGAADVLMTADGSAAGPQIAREIASWAVAPSEVIVLTVLPHESKPEGSLRAQQDHDRRVEAMTRDALAALRESGLNARVDVTYGAPGEAIVQYANECSPRVVLVGRRGAGLTKRLLGSVSEYVVANAKQPVTVVG